MQKSTFHIKRSQVAILTLAILLAVPLATSFAQTKTVALIEVGQVEDKLQDIDLESFQATMDAAGNVTALSYQVENEQGTEIPISISRIEETKWSPSSDTAYHLDSYLTLKIMDQVVRFHLNESKVKYWTPRTVSTSRHRAAPKLLQHYAHQKMAWNLWQLEAAQLLIAYRIDTTFDLTHPSDLPKYNKTLQVLVLPQLQLQFDEKGEQVMDITIDPNMAPEKIAARHLAVINKK